MRPVHAALVAALALWLSPFPSTAHAEMRIFVANRTTDLAGEVRQYSASGDDLGVFVDGLASPGYITADRTGNIYVVENSGPGPCCQGWVGTIDKFSPTGELLLAIPIPFPTGGVRVVSDGTIYVAAYGDGPNRGVYRYSASGTALGLFALPSGLSGDFIAFDPNGNLYAPNFSTGAILRISPTGADLGTFAALAGAEGIAFDRLGNMYVSSFSRGIVEKYSPSGADLGTFASTGLSSAYGLAFDSQGNLYVADYDGGKIRKLSPSGTDLGVFASTGLVGPRDLVVVESVVSYACAGFAAPFEESLTLKRHVQRAIPLTMQLVNDGTPITDLTIAGGPPVVNIKFSANGGTPVDMTDMLVPVGHSSSDGAFGFDPTTGRWSLHLGTGPFTVPGTYRVTVASGDATTYTIDPTCSGEFVRLP